MKDCCKHNNLVTGMVGVVWTHSADFSANVQTHGLVLLVSRMLTSVPGFYLIFFLSLFFLLYLECARFKNPTFFHFFSLRFSAIPGQGCQNGATCQNLPGTYQCHCTPGHQQTIPASKFSYPILSSSNHPYPSFSRFLWGALQSELKLL